MWSTGEILLLCKIHYPLSQLETFKCGLQTIIWIHLDFSFFFDLFQFEDWANIIKNNQQLFSFSLSSSPHEATTMRNFLQQQEPLSIIYTFASFTFLLLPIVMLYKIYICWIWTHFNRVESCRGKKLFNEICSFAIVFQPPPKRYI